MGEFQLPDPLRTKIPPLSHDTNNPPTPDNRKDQKRDNKNPILAKLLYQKSSQDPDAENFFLYILKKPPEEKLPKSKKTEASSDISKIE